MGLSEWERLFLREFAELLVKDGDVSLLADYAVIGMGSGYDKLPAFLERREDIKGRARTPAVFTGYHKGVRVSALAVPGGPFYTECAIRVLGMRRAKVVVGVGYCGALQEHVGVGDIVVATAAARCESVSDAYAPKEMPAVADFEVVRELTDSLRSSALRAYVGPVVTTAAPLRETEDFVRKWSEAGALAVDAECSALFTVARFERIKAGAVLAVSDSPLKRLTHAFDEELDARCRRAYVEAVKAAYDALARLARSRP